VPPIPDQHRTTEVVLRSIREDGWSGELMLKSIRDDGVEILRSLDLRASV